jgi:hypothetical protein
MRTILAIQMKTESDRACSLMETAIEMKRVWRVMRCYRGGTVYGTSRDLLCSLSIVVAEKKRKIHSDSHSQAVPFRSNDNLRTRIAYVETASIFEYY